MADVNARTIFASAIRIGDARDRARYLNQAAGIDGPLRESVDASLANYDADSVVLENSPLENALGGADSTVQLGDDKSVFARLRGCFPDLPRTRLRSSDGDREMDAADDGRTDVQRYRMYAEIARGGVGKIVHCHDVDLGRDIAAKVLLDSHADNPELARRLIEEAQIGGQLQHPGIAPVYGLGLLADERPFFTMKLVKGTTLSSLLRERDSADEDRSRFLSIFEQVCQTIAYAHS